ncbi:MAG: hypothetical protein KBT47_03015 [Armatimonadetes bacterium]|nr:hypothetical protein [Candidatus Hippobium faecium]
MKIILCLLIFMLCIAISASEKIPAKIVYAEAPGGGLENENALTDGKNDTFASFTNGNQGLKILLDLGKGYNIDYIKIINGKENETLFFLQDLQLSGFAPKGFGTEDKRLQEKMVQVTKRPINLNHGEAGKGETIIPLPKGMVGRYIYMFINGGGEQASVAETEIYGTPNKPERHLLFWSNDYKDLIANLPYLTETGITDIYLDYCETGFPQTNPNCGFAKLIDSGVLPELKKAGIRYWLGEHEAFTTMIESEEALLDDTLWETSYREMEKVYSKAKELGFSGLCYDAENYQGAIRPASEFTDHFTSWSFSSQWGYSGAYYQRGLKVGKIISENLGSRFVGLYECRIYADRNDCRQGHYWWLKGLYDGGVSDIRIATEKTYGAGNNELSIPELPGHLMYWFEHTDQEIQKIWDAYPFISGVIPGYHPWNTRIKKPCYLPQYLEDQIDEAQRNAPAFWIYNEGNPSAGDPRKTLDQAFCKENGINPNDYYDILVKTK